MISTLFAQFRHQYANGSLTTELLMNHAEQYLVKATVTIGEQVVATALAAAQDLAVADDQAKTRVLAMLGFDAAASTQPPASQSSQLPPVTHTNGSEAIKGAATQDNSLVSPIRSQIPKPSANEEHALPKPASLDPSATEDEDVGRPIDSFTPDEAPAPSQVPASALAAPTLENFDDTNPVDLSDIIAQTDVEMARLGWSRDQGRAYLEQTFNKRSRQQLTDEELLTFLLYLESQVTPSMS